MVCRLQGFHLGFVATFGRLQEVHTRPFQREHLEGDGGTQS